MTIYKGSQKEGKVYIGGTKIGKIYKGSQLVYQSIIGLPVYSFYTYSVIGEFSTNGILKSNASQPSYINSISGILGQNNSQITASMHTSYGAFTYYNTYVFNNIPVYSYRAYSGLKQTYIILYVLYNSTVGSFVQSLSYAANLGTEHPTLINENNIIYVGNTYNRGSKDFIWTIDGQS